MKAALRFLMLLVVFVACLAVTAHLIGRFDPIGEVPTVREKWAFYREHKDSFDTLFIGTSRTYRGIKSSMFDEATRAAGVPTRTLNFGVDGMFPPEEDYVATTLLEDPPKNLKWVFIEVAGFRSDFADRDPDSVRTVYWHNWNYTSMSMRSALWPKRKKVKWKTWFERDKHNRTDAWVAWTHLRLFASNSLNLGLGSNKLTRQFTVTGQTLVTDVMGPLQDGFKAMSEAGLVGKAKATYEKEMEALAKSPARIVPYNFYAEESLKRIVSRVRALGARPVLFLAPTTGNLRARPSESLALPVFDFCDIERYPELYAPEVRVDIAHLNEAGAELFTHHVAEKFIELARSQGSSHAPTPSTSR